MGSVLLTVVRAAYAVGALSIAVGMVRYSGSGRWLRRLLVGWALVLHFLGTIVVLPDSAQHAVFAYLIVFGSVAFTAWIYVLAKDGSAHFVHVLNLCVLAILIENYRTRDLSGIGLFGHWIH